MFDIFQQDFVLGVHLEHALIDFSRGQFLFDYFQESQDEFEKQALIRLDACRPEADVSRACDLDVVGLGSFDRL